MGKKNIFSGCKSQSQVMQDIVGNESSGKNEYLKAGLNSIDHVMDLASQVNM